MNEDEMKQMEQDELEGLEEDTETQPEEVDEFDSLEEDEEVQQSAPAEELPFSSPRRTNWDEEKNKELSSSGKKFPKWENMNGKVLRIVDAEIEPVPKNPKIITSVNNADTKYIVRRFWIEFENGQGQYYSGAKVFINDGEYSAVNIQRGGETQASEILMRYAEFVGLAPEQVVVSDMMRDLQSGTLLATLSHGKAKNPVTKEMVDKNFISKFERLSDEKIQELGLVKPEF